MNKRIEILQELCDTSPHLACLNKVDVFSVPNNYFDNLPDSILLKIKSLPNVLFDELNEIAPTLSSIAKQSVYTVPENYFETLKVDIPARKPITKIVALRKINAFAKYAIAAVVAGIIFTVSFWYKQHNTSQNLLPEIAKKIKNISDDELNQYADEHSIQLNYDTLSDDNDSELNITSELKDVSSEELEQYYDDHEHLKISLQQEN